MKRLLLPIVVVLASGGYVWSQQGRLNAETSLGAARPGISAVVMTMEQWELLAARVTAAGIRFGIAPHVRFKGEIGEQATMFFCDPSGNALEFKAFADDANLFA
eukprot:gene10966-14686_t